MTSIPLFTMPAYPAAAIRKLMQLEMTTEVSIRLSPVVSPLFLLQCDLYSDWVQNLGKGVLGKVTIFAGHVDDTNAESN
jgi:hypothetical protein